MKSILKPTKEQMNAYTARTKSNIKELLLKEEQKINLYMDSAVLFSLHKVFGFGKKRLKRYYDEFEKIHKDFVDCFASETDTQRKADDVKSDMAQYYVAELNKIGVDVEEWRKSHRY